MSRKSTSAKAKPAAEPAIAPAPTEPTRLASRTREETWPIGNIKPYDRNAREHSQAQIDQIRASYREFGEVQRVVVDEDGELIAGHGRHQALLQENVAEVRVAIAIDWTEDQKRRFRLIDNQLGLTSTWNEKLLKAEVAELNGLGVDVSMLGFEPGRIAGFLRDEVAGLTDPDDDIPDEPTVPCSRRGDAWVLGRHRLACGDSTNPADVARALGGAKPHLMVTDQPYGVKYDASWRSERLAIQDRAIGVVMNDDRADWRETWALFPGDVAYVWCASMTCDQAIAGIEAAGFERRSLIVWNKNNFAVGRGHYHWKNELCWYAVKKGATGHWAGDRKQSTVWDIDKPKKSETGHSTQKPVECMKRPIENNSQPGEAVYEPFSGSGTTIIAAEITGRNCHAIELNELYVDVGVTRWQNFTGLQAVLDGDGRTFAEIAAERAAALAASPSETNERLSA